MKAEQLSEIWKNCGRICLAMFESSDWIIWHLRVWLFGLDCVEIAGSSRGSSIEHVFDMFRLLFLPSILACLLRICSTMLPRSLVESILLERTHRERGYYEH